MRRMLQLLLTGLVAGLVLSCVATHANPGVKGQPKEGPKAGQFAAVEIKQGAGVSSALDFRLSGKGRAVRFYAPAWPPKDPPVDAKDPRTYFNDAGMLYTNGWIVISGVMTGTGEGFNIEHPTKDPSMLAVWSDVLGPAVQVRAANAGAESYLFQGLDRRANYTFSVEQSGALRWGTSSRAAMDTTLYRGAAKTLKTDGSLVVADKLGIGTSEPASTLHVGGSQSVQRTAVKADYAVTESDYYIGVTDTSARRTITLPSAAGKAGRVYIIKDEAGGAGTHPITVKGRPGETIDGAGSQTVGTNYGVLRVISSGSHWFGM